MCFWISSVKIVAIIISKKGFTISIGWNLGIPGKSIHLIEPFTSTPKKGTKISNIKNIINSILENKNNCFWFKIEKPNKETIPIITNKKCFKKK